MMIENQRRCDEAWLGKTKRSAYRADAGNGITSPGRDRAEVIPYIIPTDITPMLTAPATLESMLIAFVYFDVASGATSRPIPAIDS